MKRRLAAVVAVVGLVVVVSGLVWAVLVEPGRVSIRDHSLSIARWPAALDGLRIAVLSDIHEGSPFVTRERLRALVAAVNAHRPDLVVLLGDYVIHGVIGGRFHPPEDVAADLSGLRARLGVFAVFGNHDVWFDAPRVKRAFETHGITFLDDSARPLAARPGQDLWVVGLRDVGSQHTDLLRAFGGVPAGAATVVLTHNPDVFPMLPDAAVLTLAGHTHGGQVRLPLLGTPMVPSVYGSRYVNGAVHEGARWLYVTPGIGTSILPVRFNVPPEVSLLEIHH